MGGDGVLAHLQVGEDSIMALACSPNSNLLAVGGHEKEFVLWDLNTGAEVNRLGHPYYAYY